MVKNKSFGSPPRPAKLQRVNAFALVQKRISESLLLAQLRSLLPPKPSKIMADEYELSRREAPPDSDEEEGEKMELMEKCDEGDENCEGDTEIIFEEGGNSDDEVDEERPITPFAPLIKIKQMEESFLITTMVDKEVALTSDLFRMMEEERLDIVFENQYRTKTKVSHTLQVRAKLGYNVEALEEKLNVWARGKPM